MKDQEEIRSIGSCSIMLLIDVPNRLDRGPNFPLSQMLFNDDTKSVGSSDGSDEETGKALPR